MAIEITDANFMEVTTTKLLVMIDFGAQWCGPCRTIAPVVEDLSKEYEGKVVVGKVDVDENPDTTDKFGIRNVPTIIFLKDGKVVDKTIGAVPKNELIQKINENL